MSAVLHATARNAWFPFLKPAPGTRLRLVCLPYAGGGARIFRNWQAALPPDVELCAVQPPGREQRFGEAALTAMPVLVSALADALATLPAAPLAVFGHSMGALIGFELVRELRRRGLPEPQRLIVSGANAPHLPRGDTRWSDLDDPGLLDYVREMGGTPDAAFDNPELMQLFLPLFRADFSLCETYAFHEDTPLTVPVSAFGGARDQYVTTPGLAAWARHTVAPFQAEILPGNHFFIDSQADLFLSRLNGVLQQTTRGPVMPAPTDSLKESPWTTMS